MNRSALGTVLTLALACVCALPAGRAAAFRPHRPPATVAPSIATQRPSPLSSPSPQPTLAPQQSARVDQLVNRTMSGQHLAGLSLAIVRDGNVLYANAYGYRNIESGLAADVTTLYEIGEITQEFTATAILLLRQDGKLSLADPVMKYLPDLPRGAGITLRNLLNHTSGIPDYTNTPEFKRRRGQDVAPFEIVTTVRGMPLQFSPGTQYSFSNTNYVLLGMIVEKAGGIPYGDFLYERIFKSLNLNNTAYNASATNTPEFATGYFNANGNLKPALPADLRWAFSAAGLVSNVLDLAFWDAALMSGRVIDPADRNAMLTPIVLNDGRALPHAFGGNLLTLNGHKESAQGGTRPGFSTENAVFPDDRLAIVLLSNTENFRGQALIKDIFSIFYPPKPR